jgi:isovaleryl-CoA dehydrogenase
MWITNGAASDTETGDVFLVYARTGPKAISLFIVEKVCILIHFNIDAY